MKKGFRLFSLLLLLSMFLGFSTTSVLAEGEPPQKCPQFNVGFTHAIDGTKLGLSQEFPLMVEVYLGPNHKLFKTFTFEYKQMVTDIYPRGEYLIKFYSPELQTYVDQLQVGPVEFPGCSGVGIHLRYKDGAPTTLVIVRDMYPAEN